MYLDVRLATFSLNCVTRYGEIFHFGNILKVLVNYVRAYLVLGKKINLLWSTFCAIGQIVMLQMA